MLDLETIDRRIRICTVLLEKKKEQYHRETLRGNTRKCREIAKQCEDIDKAIRHLMKTRRKLGGVTDGKTD